MKSFLYFFYLIPVFIFVSQLQNTVSFNSIIKYIVPVGFLLVSIKLYLKNKPDWFQSPKDRFVFLLFSLFSFYLVFDSIRLEVFYVQEFLVGELFVLPYLLPVFMLTIKIDYKNLNQYIDIGKRLLFPGLIVLVLIILSLNQEVWILHIYFYEIFLFAFPLMFLMIHEFQERRIHILLYITIVLMVFVAVFYGRRALFLDLFLIFIFSQFIKFSSQSISKRMLIARFFIFGILVLPILLFYFSDFLQLNMFQRGLNRAAWEESRGQVLDDFFSDFDSAGDWMVGRGLNGTVKRMLSGTDENNQGRGIENGYLMLVLKGGNVYFFFVLYFFLRGFYLGWFKTNNDLTKAFAALLIIHLLGMIGFNIPVFNHRYMLLWLSVPICFSKYYRECTNSEIRSLIKL